MAELSHETPNRKMPLELFNKLERINSTKNIVKGNIFYIMELEFITAYNKKLTLGKYENMD